MAKIGILGGSFNPPHKAHREMVKQALKTYDLDAVFLMPSNVPPHKSNKEYVGDQHR